MHLVHNFSYAASHLASCLHNYLKSTEGLLQCKNVIFHIYVLTRVNNREVYIINSWYYRYSIMLFTVDLVIVVG